MYINKLQSGISLIELILFILIISIALISLLMVMNVNTKTSVDPLLRKQSLAIAESLLEEIQLQSFSNPIGGFSGAATQANRALFDDLMDYNGFATTGIYSADGSATAISGLSNYNVSVSIDNSIAWGTIPIGDTAQITVEVTNPSGEKFHAVGYRVNYE